MRVLLQRVSSAHVSVNQQIVGEIEEGQVGYVLFAGIEEADAHEDIEWLVRKICNMRLFEDDTGAMGKSLLDVEGSILLISQFTLHASVKKGNRPSFSRAARPQQALPLFQQLEEAFADALGKRIATGEFGADMKVHMVNDGPVTIWLDSKNRL